MNPNVNALDAIVSVFPKASAVNPCREITLRDLCDEIKSGKYEPQIKTLRELVDNGDMAAYKERKKQLPAVSLSANLNSRAEGIPLPEKLVSLSHVIQIDVDNVDDLEGLKEKFRADPYVLFFYDSPGGKGLKSGVRIDGTRHLESFHSAEIYFLDRYGVKIDTSVKDLPRLCFVSYDPDLFINESARILPITSNGSKPASTKQTYSPPVNPGRKLTYGERALETARKMIEQAGDGEKYYTLLKAAKLLGGYVGGGMLTRADAEVALRDAIENKANVDNLQTAYKGITNGLNYGEQSPIDFEALERQRMEYLESIGLPSAWEPPALEAEPSNSDPPPDIQWEAGFTTEKPTGAEDRDLVTAISYRELLGMEFVDNPIVEGLLDEKESLIIVGQSGIAKSICALNIACRLALTQDADSPVLFDQFTISRQCNSLFIQSENTGKATKKRLRSIIERAPWFEDGANRIFSAYIRNDVRLTGALTDQKFQSGILSLIDKTHADILFLDPLISYHSADENDNGAMRRTLDCLTVICDKANVACVVVHHAGKTGTDNQVFAGRGASAIGDWAANILVLNPGPELKTDDGSRRFLIEVSHRKARNYQTVENFFLERINGALLVPIQPQQLNPDRIKRIKTVVQILEEAGGYIDHKEILVKKVMERINKSRGSAQNAINGACEDNLIRIVPLKKGHGYRLADFEIEVDDE
jgi:hypothetical protein